MYNNFYLTRSARPYIASWSTPHVSGERLTNVEQKTNSIFSDMLDGLIALFFVVQCNVKAFFLRDEDDIFQGKQWTRTQNMGQASDALEYAKFIYTPFPVPEKVKSQAAARGFRAPNALSPTPVGSGHCEGGVNLFLKQTLKGIPMSDIAKEFNSGIPLDAVIQQQLFVELELTVKDEDILHAWKICKERNISLETKPPQITSTQYPRAAHIISAYLQYLFECRQQPALLGNHIDRINTYLEVNFSEQPLNEAEKITLNCIASKCQYGTTWDSHFILEMNGLEVKPQIPDFLGDNEHTPRAILDRVSELNPGAYKLSFPIPGRIGHTIGFVVQNDGSTVFYDPNYSITEVPKAERTRAVSKIFNHYTGYSDFGRSNLEGCELVQVKLAS